MTYYKWLTFDYVSLLCLTSTDNLTTEKSPNVGRLRHVAYGSMPPPSGNNVWPCVSVSYCKSKTPQRVTLYNIRGSYWLRVENLVCEIPLCVFSGLKTPCIRKLRLDLSWMLTLGTAVVITSRDRTWPEAARCRCRAAAQAERKTAFLRGGLPARCGRLPVVCSPLYQRLQETWVGLVASLW